MDREIGDFEKAARTVATAMKAVAVLAKVGPGDHAGRESAAEKATAALARVEGIDAAASALRARTTALAEATRLELERERALLAGAVARALGEAGVRVEGSLPLLLAGPFSLDFVFGAKGACTVWFGPKKQRLATCPLDATAIAAKVRDLKTSLFGSGLDEGAFLDRLFAAYRVVLARKGAGEGERVALTALMAEMAFAGQKRAFFADPRRENYATYGRVEFAADLSRLRQRRGGDRELRLEVATMAQTRRPEDHIWVPRGAGCDGVNYATAVFARVE